MRWRPSNNAMARPAPPSWPEPVPKPGWRWCMHRACTVHAWRGSAGIDLHRAVAGPALSALLYTRDAAAGHYWVGLRPPSLPTRGGLPNGSREKMYLSGGKSAGWSGKTAQCEGNLFNRLLSPLSIISAQSLLTVFCLAFLSGKPRILSQQCEGNSTFQIVCPPWSGNGRGPGRLDEHAASLIASRARVNALRILDTCSSGGAWRGSAQTAPRFVWRAVTPCHSQPMANPPPPGTEGRGGGRAPYFSPRAPISCILPLL